MQSCLANEFEYRNFDTSVAKFVRLGHIETTEHWRQTAFIPNGLAVDRDNGSA
jgi:hypothetical protein